MMRISGPTPRLHRGLAISLSLLALGGCLNPNAAPMETGTASGMGAVQSQADPLAMPGEAETGVSASQAHAPVETEAAHYVAAPAPLKPVKVTASAKQSDVELAIDGNLETCWNSGPKQANPSMVLDLGKVYELTEVRLKLNPDFGTYVIAVSTDGTNYTTVRSNQVNSTWNLETKTLRENEAARYVKLTFLNGSKKKAVMVFEAQPVGGVVAASPTPAPSTAPSASPSAAPSAVPSAAPSTAPSVAPTPAPTATPAPTTSTRAPNTTPIRDIGGWSRPELKPTSLYVSLAALRDGKRVAVTWLHNEPGSDALNGEPTMWASVGDPAVPSSFTPAQRIGTRPFAYASNAQESRKKYNWAHNGVFVFPTLTGGFFNMGMSFNANGYAQTLPFTGYSFVTAEAAPGATSFGAQGLAKSSSTSGVTGLSELSGGQDDAGGIHVFGQGHTGNGDMAYARRAPGSSTWQNFSLAKAFRTGSLYYFNEGYAYVSPQRNAQGRNDIHLTFGWTQVGSAPMFGLYYLKSQDGGTTWKNAAGSTVTLPLAANSNDGQAAIVRANLGTSAYSGAIPGIHGLNITETPTGAPLLTRLTLVPTNASRTQAHVYTHHNGAWVNVPVGGQFQRDANGTGIAYNAKTGRVNVVLLDPGSASAPSRVLLYHQSLADLQAGRANWTSEVVASVPNGSSKASGFRVAAVPDTRFVVSAQPNYVSASRVIPYLVEAPMR